MRKLAVTAVLLALAGQSGPAIAQQASDSTASPPTSTAVPTGTAGVLAQLPHAVPGVTVTGHKLKPCNPRDQACIEMISKELWTRFPKEIDTMCTHESIRLMQQGFQMEQLGADTTQVNTRLTPATKTLCDYGEKMKKAANTQVAPAVRSNDDPDALPKP